MFMRTCVIAVLVCGVAAASGAAQTPDELVTRGVRAGADAQLLEELRGRAAASGLSERETAGLLEPAVDLAERGLPTRMVLQKGLEGLSKRVPAARISGVLAELGSAVDRAGGVVDPWLEGPGVRESVRPPPARGASREDPVRSTIVEGTAHAFFRGASEGTVRSLLGRIPAELRAREVSAITLAVGIEVLPDVPLADRNPGMVADLVLEAVNAGFGAEELRELPTALRAAERRGQLPAEAVARGALKQMSEGTPAATVLENLFQGDFPGKPPFDLPPGLRKAQERGKPGGDGPL